MSRNWQEVWHHDRDAAFTVAGSVPDAFLSAVREVVSYALKTGASFDETRSELRRRGLV